MCDCFKIGGPFIAEDPDCPVHGLRAQQEEEQDQRDKSYLSSQLDSIKMDVKNATSVEELRYAMLALLDVLDS